jgi:hypothetical protein
MIDKKIILSVSILLGLLLVSNLFAQVHKRSLLTVDSYCEIIPDSGLLTFQYKIIININSKQRLNELTIEIGDNRKVNGGTIEHILNPKTKNWDGWISSSRAKPVNFSALKTIIWVANYDSTKSLNDTFTPPKNSLKPGESMILSIKSKGLPKIMRFWARGWVKPYTEEEYDSLITVGYKPDELLQPWYKDAYQGVTIAPVLPPKTFKPVVFLDTLISQEQRACQLNWIDNKDLCNSLRAKLNNVRKHNGKTKTAISSLQAFLNEVEAQKGKHLTSEGYGLLYYNGEYLLGKLEKNEK